MPPYGPATLNRDCRPPYRFGLEAARVRLSFNRTRRRRGLGQPIAECLSQIFRSETRRRTRSHRKTPEVGMSQKSPQKTRLKLLILTYL